MADKTPVLAEPIMDEHDLRNIEELGAALEAIEQDQNRVLINEFIPFQPLFNKETATQFDKLEIRLLSTRFIRRFNPYKPIEVFNEAGVLLFKVPQLFIPVRDVSIEYTDYVDKFRADGPSDIPKYSTEATQGLLLAILKSQQNMGDSQFASYGDYIRNQAAEYAKDVQQFGTDNSIEVSEKSQDITEGISGLKWD